MKYPKRNLKSADYLRMFFLFISPLFFLKVIAGNSANTRFPHFFSESANNKENYDLRFSKGFMRFSKHEVSFSLLKNDDHSINLEGDRRNADLNCLLQEQVQIVFMNSNSECVLEGTEPLASKTNYFYGGDTKEWRRDLQNYSSLNYNGLYDSIDLKYYMVGDEVKYDFIVYPGGSISNIKMKYSGIVSLEINLEGALCIKTKMTEMKDYLPKSYQIINGKEIPVKVEYSLTDKFTVGFRAEYFDPNFPLIIDPALIYSTFVGGSVDEYQWVGAIDRDASGNIYHTGRTFSANFPTTGSSLQSVFGGWYDAYVFKLDPTGTTLIYSTFIGGPGDDSGYSLKVEQSTGNLWVVGGTGSATFPVTPGAFQTTFGGSGLTDAYVLKLNSSGNSILYSSFFGGAWNDYGHGIDINTFGEVYITGESNGTVYTTPGAFQTAYGGGPWDGWIVKFDPTLSTVLYSTYFGGGQEDVPISIKVDQNNEVYIAGFQRGGGMPTVAGSFDLTYNGGGWDAFVAKFNSTLSAALYSTYLGTGGTDMIWNAMHVNNAGEVTVAGFTTNGFPTTAGAYQTVYGGGAQDVFVTRLNSTGTALIYSTYIGGPGRDEAYGLYVDASDEVYVTGFCQDNFPMTTCTFDSTYNGANDAFIVKLNSGASQLLFSTYLGGTASDIGYCITEVNNVIYVAGETRSVNFPVSVGAYDSSHNGGRDIFVLAIGASTLPVTAAFNAIQSICINNTIQFTNTSINASSFNWSFGDGATSILQHPSHLFLSSGSYSVKLIASSGCSVADTFDLIIQVNDLPTASFSNNSSCDLNVDFIDASIGAVQYDWDFGDTTSSSQPSPSHLYSGSGLYNVTLVVTNVFGCKDTTVQQLTLGPVPQSSFSFTQAPCSLGLSLQNLSSNAASYHWDFGDGAISSMTDPSYSFVDSGTYTITLIAISGICSDTSYQTVRVNRPPLASFLAIPDCDHVADFINLTAGQNSYHWDFGDASSSSAVSINHTYSAPGNYTISLIATNSNGCTDTVQSQINILPIPIAAFSYSIGNCTSNISLQNNSVNASNVFWDFGDGNSSTLNNPSHTYASFGNYSLKLIVSTGQCPDTLVQSVNINPKATASFSSISYCDKTINFYNTSIGSISSYYWDFGDTDGSSAPDPIHTYSSSGSYQVKLIITDQFNCLDTISHNILIRDDATASFSFTPPLCETRVVFQNSSLNSSNFHWTFGDGSISNNLAPIHDYLASGSYTVMLIADSGACPDTMIQQVAIQRGPVVDFNSILDCSSDAEFLNLSDSVDSYIWYFGDGTMDTTISPIHSYNSPGTYKVTLTGTNSLGCRDSLTKAIDVVIFSEATFVSTYDTCQMKATFQSTSVNSSNLFWDLGYGLNSDKELFDVVFSSAGSYTITLVTNRETACADTSQSVFEAIEEQEYGLYIPNCFSPNGDGINELFKVIDYGSCEIYRLMIFNRWGEMIFETQDLHQGWDGTYLGRKVQGGVYAWLLKGDLKTKVGSVLVLD
jgi:gliding motility-associated-like protein